MKCIRLTDAEVLAIAKAFRKCFSGQDHLWLFGSRVDLQKRGGDIDLYVETMIKDPQDLNDRRMLFLSELENALGEQRIDVVINSGLIVLPIHQEAREKGIQIL